MSMSNKTTNIKMIIMKIIPEMRLSNGFSEENILIICFISSYKKNN